MDLQSNLIESKKQTHNGGWKASAASVVLHGVLIASIVFLGASSAHKIDAEDKPIRAFITQGAAPPPPPPPPPAPAAGSSAPKATPHIEKIEQPKPVPHDAFIPPREVPKELPKVELPSTNATADDVKPAADSTPATPAPVEGGVDGGVTGGVVGGQVGGVVGGVIGGVKGGEIGGVKGGELGGVVGGKLGGTGSGTEGEGNGNKEAEPVKAPDGPVRVGGNVKAPTVVDRTDPKYTDTARAARVSGVVIVEAIIDKNGNVDQVKVLKGLPMGLSEEAERAVRQWHFKPGTMNGEPVDVIFNLTVNFKLGS